MQDQIQEILRREGLSASQFADRIGVQRSSVSHVISGRNKPGFDFIRKILETFPAINAEWLITGSGAIYSSIEPAGTAESPEEGLPLKPEKETPEPEKKPAEIPVTIQNNQKITDSREIDRIIVFYKDKTFREYRQES